METQTYSSSNDLIPDEIDFTNSDIDRSLQRPKLRANTCYKGKVTEAKKGVWPSGELTLDMTFAPMDADGRTRFPTATYRLSVPFANPKKPEAPVPESWRAHNFLNALYPDKFPKAPRFNKADGTYVTAAGEVVDKATAKSIERQIAVDVHNAIKAYWKNPAELANEVAYIVIKDDEYRNVLKVTAEPPTGMEVRLSDFADTL